MIFDFGCFSKGRRVLQLACTRITVFCTKITDLALGSLAITYVLVTLHFNIQQMEDILKFETINQYNAFNTGNASSPGEHC